MNAFILFNILAMCCLSSCRSTDFVERIRQRRNTAVAGEVVTGKSYITPSCQKPFEEKVYGVVYISQSASGGSTTMRVILTGMKPSSVHGFHIHTYGDIHERKQGCLGAGGHYNPFGLEHGAKNDSERHVGDLGNIVADKYGRLDVTFEDRLVSIVGVNSVAGRAFVLHEKKDDLGRGTGSAAAGSKKTGNAGSRLACGEIFLTSPATVLGKLNTKN